MLNKFDEVYKIIMQQIKDHKSIVKEDCDPGFIQFVNSSDTSSSSPYAMSKYQKQLESKRKSTYNKIKSKGGRISDALRAIQKNHNNNADLTTYLDGCHYFFYGDYEGRYKSDTVKGIFEETGLKVSQKYLNYIVHNQIRLGDSIKTNKNLMKKFDTAVDKISDAVENGDQNIDEFIKSLAKDFVKNDFSTDSQVLSIFTPTSQQKQQLYEHRVLPAFKHYVKLFKEELSDNSKMQDWD